MFNRIVVPLDGSPLAEQAVEIVGELASRFDVPIGLVRVTEQYPLHRGSPIDYTGSAETERLVAEEATAYLAALAEKLRNDGRTVSVQVLRGDAADQIIAAAQPGDLIVIASHGRTGMLRWFMGSVAESVMRRAKGSVLLHRIQSTETTGT